MRVATVALAFCFILFCSIITPVSFGLNVKKINKNDSESILLNDEGPLGEWPDFNPIGFITAPHPDFPEYQTHLYGDWGGIVGEEFIFIQENFIKLLYHSYHETYMTDHLHTEEVLHDWTLGYNPTTKIKYTPLAKPGGPYPGPAWDHTDTPGYIQHPISGEHLLYNTVRPGTKYLHPEWDGIPGWEGAIQVATSDTSPTIGVPFQQTYQNMLVAEYWWEQGWNQNGVIKGGLSEPTPVWVPHLGDNGMVRLFYRGLHGSPSSYWNWRISYADSEDGKTDWTKNPIPTFDPSDPDNPAYQWTLPYPEGFSFRGSWQAHCTGDIRADGVHMVLCVSNQNYAGFGHIAYYWSPDWGDTWIGHPDNPIIAPGQHPQGVPPEGFQRTPTLLVDEKYERYILAYNAGHDVNERWKRRTYLAIASRPFNPSPEIPTLLGPNIGKIGQLYAYNISSSDPDEEDIFYWIDWGDDTNTGWLGPFSSGKTILESHLWDEVGEFEIKVKARDEYNESDWSETLSVIITNPPKSPEITGPISGRPGLSYEFGFSTIEPDGEDISEIIINWGDDKPDEIITGPFASGEKVKVNHTWIKKGDFVITAKAKDVNGVIGSESISSINIPRKKIANRFIWFGFLDRIPLFQKLINFLVKI